MVEPDLSLEPSETRPVQGEGGHQEGWDTECNAAAEVAGRALCHVGLTHLSQKVGFGDGAEDRVWEVSVVHIRYKGEADLLGSGPRMGG